MLLLPLLAVATGVLSAAAAQKHLHKFNSLVLLVILIRLLFSMQTVFVIVARGCFDRSFKVPVFAETDKISLRLRCEFVCEEHSSLSLLPLPPPSLLLSTTTTTTKIIQFH